MSTEPSRAIFLSYASQDAEPARRICDALRAAGIEVWFDQSELRGGEGSSRTRWPSSITPSVSIRWWAFQWLERAYEQNDGGLTEVKVDPVLASLRTDPRYHAFLVKMKLAR